MNSKIRIPEKYKADLEHRFNPDNAEWNKEKHKYYLSMPCVLCGNYRSCAACPFGFEGCKKIIHDILGTWHLHFYGGWSKRNNQKARAQLRKLNREAGKYIEWVKEN